MNRSMNGSPAFDEDALIAAVDLVGRAGARDFELGYLDDDVPVEKARWYAVARYGGNRITAEDHRDPVAASESPARRILEGGKCRCGRLVALSDSGAMFYSGTMADGSEWTAEQATRAGQCRWTREGKKWYGACGAGRENRKQRRSK